MATVLGGTEGKIIVPGSTVQIALLNKWSMSVDRTIHDTSSYDVATNERTRIGGMMVTTGSASGFADAATTPILTAMQTADDAGASGFQLVLRDGTNTDAAYTFTAIVGSMVVEVDKQGMALFSFDFTVTGIVAVTTFADA